MIIFPVDVDLHRGPVGEIVHLVDLVPLWHEKGYLTWLGHVAPVVLLLSIPLPGTVVHPAQGGLGEAVVRDSNHALVPVIGAPSGR